MELHWTVDDFAEELIIYSDLLTFNSDFTDANFHE